MTTEIFIFVVMKQFYETSILCSINNWTPWKCCIFLKTTWISACILLCASAVLPSFSGVLDLQARNCFTEVDIWQLSTHFFACCKWHLLHWKYALWENHFSHCFLKLHYQCRYTLYINLALLYSFIIYWMKKLKNI